MSGPVSLPDLRSKHPVDARAEVRTGWFIRVRWSAFAGQILVLLTARNVFRLDLPYGTLFGLALVVAITNAWLSWRARHRRPLSPSWCGGVLALDTLQLTAMLFLSGGTSNPFSVFYLVHITIAAVMLGSRWTWALAVLGASSYAALFLLPAAPDTVNAAHAMHRYSQHLQAMWLALTLSAALTTYFVTRLTTIVAERDLQIVGMRETAARHERLAALTTLAAGAAHELGTPLATVAVAAGELERAVAALPPAQAALLVDDVRLIRAELRRCRDIIDGMAGNSGHAAGEMPTVFGQRDLREDLVASLSANERSRTRITDREGPPGFFLPRRAVARVVSNLIRNALDATPDEAVHVDIDAGPRLRIRVSDTGPGMPPAILAQAGEPFFTTKAPGHGLGLGLFLARSLADHLGGSLVLDSAPGRGTTAVLELPLRIEIGAAGA